jgi:hypothetical protein
VRGGGSGVGVWSIGVYEAVTIVIIIIYIFFSSSILKKFFFIKKIPDPRSHRAMAETPASTPRVSSARGARETGREKEGRLLASLRAEHGMAASHAPWWGGDPEHGAPGDVRLYSSSPHRAHPERAGLEATIARATGAAPPLSPRVRRSLRARAGGSAGHGQHAARSRSRAPLHPNSTAHLSNTAQHGTGGLPPLLALQSGRAPRPPIDEDLATATDLVEGNHQHFIDDIISTGMDVPTVIDKWRDFFLYFNFFFCCFLNIILLTIGIILYPQLVLQCARGPRVCPQGARTIAAARKDCGAAPRGRMGPVDGRRSINHQRL